MVVVPEPAVKGAAAFLARAVDVGVGPAVEHGADEAFGFAVGLWPVGAGAEVADAESAAGDLERGVVMAAGRVVAEGANRYRRPGLVERMAMRLSPLARATARTAEGLPMFFACSA